MSKHEYSSRRSNKFTPIILKLAHVVHLGNIRYVLWYKSHLALMIVYRLSPNILVSRLFPPLLLMNKLPVPFIVPAIVLLAVFAAFAIWGIPYFFRPLQIVSNQNAFGSDTIRARVTKIVEEG